MIRFMLAPFFPAIGLIDGATKLYRLDVDYSPEIRLCGKLLSNSLGLGIVSHGMWGDRFRNAAEVMRFLTGLLDGVPGDVLAGDITWKQPVDGSLRAPPVAQGFQQFR